MAFKATKPARELTKVSVICKGDDAVDWEDAATDYEGYRQTGDEAKLVIIDGQAPTRFVCNFDLPGQVAKRLKNHMVAGKDTEGNPSFAYGDWAYDVVRRTLVSIDQPESLTVDERIHLKRDQDKLVHSDTMKVLERLGLVDQLAGWYTTLVMQGSKVEAKN